MEVNGGSRWMFLFEVQNHFFVVILEDVKTCIMN